MAKHRQVTGSKAALLEAEAPDHYLVPALIRRLLILQELSGERRRLTLSEVAAALDVTRSSAYRLLFTLCHLGFVAFDTETYALGSQVLRHVGARLPAHATTMGRVLLSGLPNIEVSEPYRDESPAALAGNAMTSLTGLLDQLAGDSARGVVGQNSGYEPGVASIAAPIHDMTGHIIAATNISVVALLTKDTQLNGSLKAEVLAAAEAISRDLGHSAAGPDDKDLTPARRSTS